MGENTTYEELVNYFKSNTKVTDLDLPDSEEGWLSLMNLSKMEFNIRLHKNIACDDMMETLSEKLTDGTLVYFTECMRLITLKNMLSDFISVWEVFNNDLGRRNYREQKSGRENLVRDQEDRLRRLAIMIVDDFDVEV